LRGALYLDARGNEKIAWRSIADRRPADVSSVFMKGKTALITGKSLGAVRVGGRELINLISVGPATVRDLHLLGVRSVAQLARAKPESLYSKLCRLRGRQDPCCLDVFSAAVAQARNPTLPAEKCAWWYWSRQRKAKSAAQRGVHG
jgi:hypothetical protein